MGNNSQDAKSPRSSLSPEEEANLLDKCRRRCCLCFALDNDLSEKEGQLCHLDRDRSNGDPDNIVFLCLRHHNLYDTRYSQSKGMTQKEVHIYRDRLYAVIKQRQLQFDSASADKVNGDGAFCSGGVMDQQIYWIDQDIPSLPLDMSPFDKALVEILLRVPRSWGCIIADRLSHTQEIALDRLVEAGIVEQRVVLAGYMEGSKEVLTLLCRVSGDYKRELLAEAVRSVPKWHDKDNKVRGTPHFLFDVGELRITDQGELARHDWTSPEPSSVLAILRGGFPMLPGLKVRGAVKIESRRFKKMRGPVDDSVLRQIVESTIAESPSHSKMRNKNGDTPA